MRGIGTLYFKAGDQEKKVETFGFFKFNDGFSFEVKTELEAYQSAFLYQHSKRVTVRPCANTSNWLVSVYSLDHSVTILNEKPFTNESN